MSKTTKQKLKVHQVEQGTSEWFQLRIQYPLTASNAQAIGNQGAGLETLCWNKLAEKYSQAPKEQFSNIHLERGKELEPLAIEMYELETGNKVEKIGFVTNESISKKGGASPDGAVDEDGLTEVKAFDDVKHFKMIVEKKKTGSFKIESQYVWQMQQQLLFTQRKWCDFIAYNPNFPESLLIQRVYPDPEMQEKIKAGLKLGEKIIKDIEINLK